MRPLLSPQEHNAPIALETQVAQLLQLVLVVGGITRVVAVVELHHDLNTEGLLVMLLPKFEQMAVGVISRVRFGFTAAFYSRLQTIMYSRCPVPSSVFSD